MLLRDWDRELDRIDYDVARIEKLDSVQRRSFARKLGERKAQILGLHARMMRSMDQIAALGRRSVNRGSDAERSIVYWSMLFAKRLHNIYEKKSRNSTRAMWLQMIRLRLSGGAARRPSVVGDDEVVETAVRHANLAELEVYLIQQYDQLQKRKQELHRRYEQISAAKSNHEAAGSMGVRLGVDVDDALKNSMLVDLGRLLKRVTAPLRWPDAARELVVAEQEVDQQTTGFFATCRDYVTRTAHRDVLDKSTARRLDTIRTALRQVESAGRRLEKAEKVVDDEELRPAHPRVRPTSSGENLSGQG